MSKKKQEQKRSAIEQAKANAVMKKCGCECHEPGVCVMHFMACCEHCYEKIVDLRTCE